MKARVIEEECIGDGSCADTCPEVFEMRDDGVAHVIADPVPPEAEEKCRQACEDCPVDAIVVEE
ncbi:ferredoxin [bacterium]|nr:ferredoxin [bacterium]